MAEIKIIMAQVDPIVGDIKGNTELIIATAKQALEQQADIVVFPEMTITGYPPEDLLFRLDLYKQVEQALSEICKAIKNIVVVVGYPMIDSLEERFNMASWIEKGQIKASYIKQNLPNYSVFDEQRYFSAADRSCVVEYKGVKVGLLICEDIWKISPANQAIKDGAEILLTLNASPFSLEKQQDRIDIVKRRVAENKVPIIYVNQVGGQDELVFDGGSFAINSDGSLQVQATAFKTSLETVIVNKQNNLVSILSGNKQQLCEGEARVYQAIVMGIKDYVAKNCFPGVLIGLSGGIDSALTLALAVDSLGADKVEVVMMPFRYTASISIEDAAQQAKTMGVEYQSIAIEDIYTAFESSLIYRFDGYDADVTEENLQARIRGTILMSISNKTGKMVLATSNKSEVAVGYSTLYGDMVGGFSPLKDVPKTLVYKLAEYRNSIVQVIPTRVITRAPTAELRAEQTDQDSLPDYDTLDAIIREFIKFDKSPLQISNQLKIDLAEVTRVVKMINRNEYKRRQATPGIKITNRAFGKERRYPITSHYQEK
jgi:NAD+ synthase (glutamine-hydrolysing)